jgi:tetratricopeptide (TPR) repeat protein
MKMNTPKKSFKFLVFSFELLRQKLFGKTKTENFSSLRWFKVDHLKLKTQNLKLLPVFFSLFLIPSLGAAQTLTTAGDGLQSMNLPDGAKASALGGAFSAWADDTSAVYWNPAGMVWLPKIQVQTAFNQWFQDTFFQDLSGVYPMDWGALGARLSYINLGSIAGRDQFGVTNGITISPEDWGGTFAAAGRLGDFSAGLAVKSYDEILSNYYNYGGLAVDAGAMFRSGLLSLAGGVRDLDLASGNGFPAEYYGGAALALGPKSLQFHLATDVTFTDGGQVFHHGLEIGYQQTVFLRAGYQWLPQPLPNQDQAGLSGGVGLALSDFSLDYAIVSYGDLGLTNQVSLAYQFTLPQPTPTESDDEDDARSSGGGARGETTPSTPVAATGTVTKNLPPPPLPTPTPVLNIIVEPATTPQPAQPAASTVPLSLRAAYNIGITAYQAGDYAKAADYLKQAVKTPAGQSETVFVAEGNAMLGVIYQFRLKVPGNLDLARQYYQAALKVDPTNGTALRHLPQVQPDATEGPSR